MKLVNKKITSKGVAGVLIQNSPMLILPFLDRSRTRQRVTLNQDEEVALSLPRGSVMRGGDLLIDEDGRFIRVIAAEEKILRVESANTQKLLQAAYHLGNRHTPVEVGQNYLHLEYDPVLEDMLKGLGVSVTLEMMPFEPEHGAYGGGHKHGHDETFAEDYEVAQSVYKEHEPHSHVHDEHCGHYHHR